MQARATAAFALWEQANAAWITAREVARIPPAISPVRDRGA